MLRHFTVAEIASRLEISKQAVSKRIKTFKLKEGKHFYRSGSTIIITPSGFKLLSK